eukprot:CCRYP_003209-RA/>CCRYP_003209-RA protein AED:0.04 eAED:0.04 QI:87/1/1/1/1/1/3/379/492
MTSAKKLRRRNLKAYTAPLLLFTLYYLYCNLSQLQLRSASVRDAKISGGESALRSLDNLTKTTQPLNQPLLSPNRLIWNSRGCQEWSHPNVLLSPNGESTVRTSMTPIKSPSPTGIAVTLAKQMPKASKTMLNLLCQKLPTQQAYFFEPQNIDLLLLIDMGDNVTYTQVADCLELVPFPSDVNHVRTWTNLDGTNLTTYEYRTKKRGRSRVYLAPFVMPYPQYIQNDSAKASERMEGCDRGAFAQDYVQGTRYYTDSVLNLAILKNYDYFLKVDLDIEFDKSNILGMDLLHDMEMRGALFGHTGEFLPSGLAACCGKINNFVHNFVENGTKPWAAAVNWTRACSAGLDCFEMEADQYYTNFVILSVPFFQSEHVRQFGREMNEYYPGFFRYGWSDQIFFHKAMGLFLGPDFRSYVADYTDFRCKKFRTCWYFWASAVKTNGTGLNFCSGGGIFQHGKTLNFFGAFDGQFPNVTAIQTDRPYKSRYIHDCDII